MEDCILGRDVALHPLLVRFGRGGGWGDVERVVLLGEVREAKARLLAAELLAYARIGERFGFA